MKCELCGIKTQWKLCEGCKEFLQWRYPGEKPKSVVERYKRESFDGGYSK